MAPVQDQADWLHEKVRGEIPAQAHAVVRNGTPLASLLAWEAGVKEEPQLEARLDLLALLSCVALLRFGVSRRWRKEFCPAWAASSIPNARRCGPRSPTLALPRRMSDARRSVVGATVPF